MIDRTYQPSAIEGRIYAKWEAVGAFRAGRPERSGAKPYCIVIPPPNVTGSLHMGHALNNTLQDVLVRFARMRGRDVLWQPGTDHAGIATQMVVERQLMERQEPGRRALGREKFLEKVWAWKAESGGAITTQLKRLGASCDWSRERFTMDAGLSRAVLKVFVELYRAGLIYKDKRLVNWDPKLLTAISDLEVQQVEVNGHLWHIRYPLEGAAFDPDNPSTFITVATTRPETMLGDVAVAVHPDDERYKPLVGKHAILPLVGRRIPIIADEYSDPEKGTGAVKITPAHDFNDFEVWKRHKDNELKEYKLFSIFDQEAHLLLSPNFDFKSNIVDSYVFEVDGTIHDLNGKDRFEARKLLVEMLERRNHSKRWKRIRTQSRTVTVPVSSSSPSSRINGMLTPRRSRNPQWRRYARDAPCSCRAIGRRPISVGWRTSSPGAFHASSGGVIRSPHGMDQLRMSSATTTSIGVHSLQRLKRRRWLRPRSTLICRCILRKTKRRRPSTD